MTQQPTPTEHDPICHMDITIANAAGRSEHEGHTYYFCSEHCQTKFSADGERYAVGAGATDARP